MLVVDDQEEVRKEAEATLVIVSQLLEQQEVIRGK